MPAHDTAPKRGTEEVTSPESVEGDLLELIREAIATDLRVNLVFSSVRIHLEHPELLIRGVIYEFAESHSRPWWARLPLVGLLPAARERVEGGVKLDLVVSTPTGYVVGTYQGRSVFPDPTKPDPAPGEMRRPRGTHLNRAFTEAMRQIREQMLADRLLISGQWRQVSLGQTLSSVHAIRDRAITDNAVGCRDRHHLRNAGDLGPVLRAEGNRQSHIGPDALKRRVTWEAMSE